MKNEESKISDASEGGYTILQQTLHDCLEEIVAQVQGFSFLAQGTSHANLKRSDKMNPTEEKAYAELVQGSIDLNVLREAID